MKKRKKSNLVQSAAVQRTGARQTRNKSSEKFNRDTRRAIHTGIEERERHIEHVVVLGSR